MKKMFVFGFAAAMLCLCGCRTQIVALDVVPYDAKVIANGVAYDNHSPMFIEACTGKELLITAYKDGYRDKIYAIDYQLSTLGKIEAFTSFLILPAFGLFSDHSWELKESNVKLTLEPVSPEAKKEAAEGALRLSPAGNPDDTKDPNAKKIFNQL